MRDEGLIDEIARTGAGTVAEQHIDTGDDGGGGRDDEVQCRLAVDDEPTSVSLHFGCPSKDAAVALAESISEMVPTLPPQINYLEVVHAGPDAGFVATFFTVTDDLWYERRDRLPYTACHEDLGVAIVRAAKQVIYRYPETFISYAKSRR